MKIISPSLARKPISIKSQSGIKKPNKMKNTLARIPLKQYGKDSKGKKFQITP